MNKQIERSMPAETQIYMPILRIDKEKREVVVRATSESKDSYKTIFRYDASKEAFAKWRGNIREMHEPKAVGRALKVNPIDEEKAIDLTIRISRGAEDTWQKVLDGTLSGASVGARNGTWEKEIIDGEEVPVLTRYDLVEVSLVDNPSNPDCNISIIRADGIATEVLDEEPDEEEIVSHDTVEEAHTEVPEETRAGAKHSVESRAALHTARDHALQAAVTSMKSCNCEDCQSGMSRLDPDNDGDIDLVNSLDVDNDGGTSGDGSGNGQSRIAQAEITRIVSEELTRYMQPITTRMSGIASRLAQVNTSPADITRRLEAIDNKLGEQSELRSLLSEVKEVVTLIAAQPQAGGPIVNSAALQAASPAPQSDIEAQVIARLSKAGVLNKQQQINAALYLQGRQ